MSGSELAFPRSGGSQRVGWRRGRRWRSADTRGYVAKDERSVYSGGPTRRWLKVKQENWTVAEDRWQRRIFEENSR